MLIGWKISMLLRMITWPNTSYIHTGEIWSNTQAIEQG